MVITIKKYVYCCYIARVCRKTWLTVFILAITNKQNPGLNLLNACGLMIEVLKSNQFVNVTDQKKNTLKVVIKITDLTQLVLFCLILVICIQKKKIVIVVVEF